MAEIIRRAFLRELCGTHKRISTPFSQEFDGALWDVAVIAYAIAMVRVSGAPAYPARADAPRVANAIRRPQSRARVTMCTALRDWACGTERCVHCAGTGILTSERDTPYACRCDDGFRKSSGSLLGVVISRRLLWRYLRCMPIGPVIVEAAGQLDALAVRDINDGWRVYIMPIVRESVTEPIDEFPYGSGPEPVTNDAITAGGC